MCNRYASHARTAFVSKLNFFSGIDLTLVLYVGFDVRSSASEASHGGASTSYSLIFGLCAGAGGGVEPPRPEGRRILIRCVCQFRHPALGCK